MTTQQVLVPVRRTARQREERRIRIMGMVRSGFSYEVIARDECLSRERIRQIVTQSLKTDDRADRVDQARVQMARWSRRCDPPRAASRTENWALSILCSRFWTGWTNTERWSTSSTRTMRAHTSG